MLAIILGISTSKVLADENNVIESSNESANEITASTSNDETETKDIYSFDQKITLSDNIKGNMFAMGQDVTIVNADVNGDIFVMGQDVTIDASKVHGNIFVMGQNVNIKGETSANSVYAFAQNIKIEAPCEIAYALRVSGENITLSGRINEVLASGENITVGSKAVIGGKFEYTSSNEATIEEGTTINKDLVKFNKEEEKQKSNGDKVKDKVLKVLTTFITIVVLSLVFTLWDKKFGEFVQSAKPWSHIWKSILIGFISVLIPLVATVFMVCTSVTIELSLVLILAYIVTVLLASSASITAISKMIFNKAEGGKLYGKTVLIGLAYSILSVLPYIGNLLATLVIFGGIGMVLRRVFYKK